MKDKSQQAAQEARSASPPGTPGESGGLKPLWRAVWVGGRGRSGGSCSASQGRPIVGFFLQRRGWRIWGGLQETPAGEPEEQVQEASIIPLGCKSPFPTRGCVGLGSYPFSFILGRLLPLDRGLFGAKGKHSSGFHKRGVRQFQPEKHW